MGVPVEERLITDISEQLSDHMRNLRDAVDGVESQIRNGLVPAERLEVAAQRAAAGVIAAVGALRALAEIEQESDSGDDEDDDEDDED